MAATDVRQRVHHSIMTLPARARRADDAGKRARTTAKCTPKNTTLGAERSSVGRPAPRSQSRVLVPPLSDRQPPRRDWRRWRSPTCCHSRGASACRTATPRASPSRTRSSAPQRWHLPGTPLGRSCGRRGRAHNPAGSVCEERKIHVLSFGVGGVWSAMLTRRRCTWSCRCRSASSCASRPHAPPPRW